MRPKVTLQPELDFQPSNLKLTNEYYKNYGVVSKILDDNPLIIELVHSDLKDALRVAAMKGKAGGGFKYTSDTVLRILMCQTIEGLSLREVVIRIDDSHFLRQFVRIYTGPMMDFTTLCKLKNHISPETWKKVNELLAQYAVQHNLIEGARLRLDTSAVETNIHWPTDSSLLWDSYRVLARLIEAARKLDPQTVGSRRLHPRRARRLAVKISRKSSKSPDTQEALKSLYERLIPLVTSICQAAETVRLALQEGITQHRYGIFEEAMASRLAKELAHFRHLGLRVIDQSSRRVFDGEAVPNDKKVFSIFEAHTELLKRGKAAKPIEFGHMIQIQQVDCKFITGYEVFAKKPVEHTLLESSLNSHRQLFGHDPKVLAADKGYYENMAAIQELQKTIRVVSIAKKGHRTEEEIRREANADFRFGQRFRAGIEGTISFLKRILGLCRCFNKGWKHFVSTVGATIFTHNVLILARR